MQPAAAIIVAAGRGERMAATEPKQFLALDDKSVLAHAVEAFASHPLIGPLVVVTHSAERSRAATLLGSLAQRVLWADGGETRQQSVAAGLARLEEIDGHIDQIVLVHDAARPFVSETLITRAIVAASRYGAAVPGLAIADTVKRVEAAGQVVDTLDRGPLRAIQTPQAFKRALLRRAHAHAASGDGSLDDAMLIEAMGLPVHVFEGEARAFKLTTPADLIRARQMLAPSMPMQSCVGQGFDVHRFGVGDHIMLGGVRIPHHAGLIGHSDADVLLHAMTDAILGALGDGDIGQHFPPSDERWRGVASSLFLADAARRVTERGGRLSNVDAMVLAEAPRIMPHAPAMRATIAAILALPLHRVGIKATTTETLGFVGRGEGIACLASAALLLPADDEGPR